MSELELYHQNIEHYYRRWRDTELIIQRRSQAWITGLALAGVIFTFGGTAIGDIEKTLLWTLSTLFSVGIFFRLIAARHSIIRSIAIINLNRRHQNLHISGDPRKVSETLLQVDTQLPKLCKIFTSSSAAASFSAFSAYMALRVYLADSETVALIGAASLLAIETVYYFQKCKKLSATVEKISKA